MARTIEFPPNLKIAGRSDPHLLPRSRSGGMSLAGIEQIIAPLSSVWTWRVSVPLRNKIDIRSARLIKTQLAGRFNYLRMGVCDQARLTRRDVGINGGSGPFPHGDLAFFSDDTGYQNNITAPIMADASRGDSQIIVRASDFGGAISSGILFSVDDWLYLIEGWEVDGSNYVLDILPVLRSDITTSMELDTRAIAVWTLDDDRNGDFDLNIGRFGTMNFTLTEAIGRLG